MQVNDDDEVIPLLDSAEPLQPEFKGYAPDQMVTCETCLRANPPTRTNCLYCAAVLPATEASAALRRPTLRRLEKWEQGFNSILLPDKLPEMNDEALGEAAQLLRLTPEDLKLIIETGEPLPLARAATLDEASLIERRLEALNIHVITVGDQELALEDSSNVRVRALEFMEDALAAHGVGGGAPVRVSLTEVLLLVVGRRVVRRIEVEQRSGGRKEEKDIADARELSSDEALLDIYTVEATGGWRIASGQFDFSCLGERKGLLASQNFSTLIEMLRERTPQALYDDSYHRVRRALAFAWPLDQHTASHGLRRERPGKYNVESVTTSDNEAQFTRYSRLRHYLSVRHHLLKRS
jgi:hypothetical protein